VYTVAFIPFYVVMGWVMSHSLFTHLWIYDSVTSDPGPVLLQWHPARRETMQKLLGEEYSETLTPLPAFQTPRHPFRRQRVWEVYLLSHVYKAWEMELVVVTPETDLPRRTSLRVVRVDPQKPPRGGLKIKIPDVHLPTFPARTSWA
jgi:hypothetical protein